MSPIVLAFAASIAGAALTSLGVWRTWQFFRAKRGGRPSSPFAPMEARPASASRPDGSTPLVSILKPVCGLDDGLEENLRSFLALEDVRYEVIVSVADDDDPALPIVRRVMNQAPAGLFRLIVGGGGAARNRKVERLIAAMQVAAGSLILVSDSNVRATPRFLADTLDAFSDPEAGCISNPFTAAETISAGARIEGIHLLTFVLTGNVLASWVGATCVVGKSMMLRRTVLERIGGFDAFRDVLAEDQAIGLAVARAGYRIALAPVLVRNVTTRRTVRAAVERQIRWNRIRFSFSPLLYSCEFLVNPAPLGIVTSAALVGAGVITPWAAVAASASFVVLRMIQAMILAAASGVRLGLQDLALVPIQDGLQFAAQFAPWISREIQWRGRRARLGPGTLILDEPESAAA